MTPKPVIGGPMGHAYVELPCGHGRARLRWAEGELRVIRRCRSCKRRFRVAISPDGEDATVAETLLWR